MKKITKIIISLGILSPVITFAVGKDLKYLIDIVLEYFTYAVWLIIGLATVMFVWNVYKYFIAGSDDVSAKKEAGQYVLWSIIGFFAILSLWGLVNILKNTFNLDSNSPSGLFNPFKPSNSNIEGPGGSNTGGFIEGPGGSNTGANSTINGTFSTPPGSVKFNPNATI